MQQNENKNRGIKNARFLWNSVLIVAVAAAATFLTRVIPFAAFGKRKIPQTVDYLGRILPSAIIATLVVYCLRNVDFISGYHGAAEIIAVAAICVLHLWRRNTLLSVGGGTVVYMILVQVLA